MGAGLSSLAAAQPVTTPAPVDEIGEIVVTAQKRAESAQNVPIAITTLDNAQLRATLTTGTADLRAVVPALNITTGTGGFGLPRIRGIGATGQGPGLENPVAVYVDGVYYGAAFGVLQSLFDAQQVAVLKGPQGTLFGRNATGGLIQITTMAPSFEPAAKVEIGYGNYNTLTAAGFISTGLTDKIAFSLSGQFEDRTDGFGVNLFTGNDIQDSKSWSGRGKLLFEPGDSTSITLAGDFNGRDAAEPAFRNFGLNTLGQNLVTQIIALGGDPDRDINSDTDPNLRARQWGTSLTIDQDFGGISLKSITAYRKSNLTTLFDPDGTTLKRVVINNKQFDTQFTQEFNLVSASDGPFKWVLGAFYMSGSAGFNPGQTTGLLTFGGNGYSRFDTEVGLKSIAGFAEGTYTLGESTNLIAGFRYTSDKRDVYAVTTTYNGATGVTTIGTPTERDVTFNKPTWRLSIDHRFSPELLAYASYNRGFRSGTFTSQTNPVALLNPETVDAYEVGFKSDLYERRIRFNLAAYYYDQTNIQIQQTISGVQYIYNAEGAEIYGLDGDLTIQASRNLRLFGGFNFTSAHYTNFPQAVITYPLPLPAGFVLPTGQTCVGTQPVPGPFVQPGGNCLLRGNASGNRLQNTPELTVSLGGAWDVPTSIGKFTAAANYYYNDGFVGTPDERVVQPGFSTVDASLTWRANNEKLFVRLWGKNLTDAFFRTQIGATNTGDNGTNGAPRTFGISLGFDM